MKTASLSINDVLKDQTTFFIPPFQRAYAWERQEIERYFSDILRIIASELDPMQNDKLEHFFGTLVIKKEALVVGSRSVVIDGQQRLTTTLIFLIALRDSFGDSAEKEKINQTYLFDNKSTFEDKIKLKQVTKDWDAYKALVNMKEPKPGKVTKAYELLKRLMIDKRKTNPDINIEHYIKAMQRINVAVILLDERPHKGEDPQVIFETLNSLGKPLTLSDLIRNFILLNMKSDKQSEVYENIWYPQIEEVLNENTSKFFRDYLQYKTRKPLKVVSNNNTRELYHQFKEFVDLEFKNRDDFIEDIIPYVECYKWIISEVVTDNLSVNQTNDKEIKELLRNIFHDIKSEAFKPFILGLLKYHRHKENDINLSDDVLISALETIRNYLIRRRVLGLAQGENKVIVTYSDRIKDIARGKVTILNLLSNLTYRLRLPNDDDIRRQLQIINFYEELKRYSKFILGKIEKNNTKVAPDFRDPKITIEHIMPQTLSDEWKEDLGGAEKYKEIYDQYLHNIGNLILTEFNAEIGNKPFEEKKRKLEESTLNYRRSIISMNEWNQDSMKKHQKRMIDSFLNTFSLPDEYKYNSNYRTQKDETPTIFSPVEQNSGEIAEGNKPVELYIENKQLKVKTWQDVFIEFLKHLKISNEDSFNIILYNQSLLFNKEDTIIRWGVLKNNINSNPDLSNRYKTFNGKSPNRAKNLDEQTLFIHVSMSAFTCMSRISKVMNMFNMDENSVKISLR